jgi:hypothetical protein
MMLFERCYKARQCFGINFNHSYFFDHCQFIQRKNHLVGVNEVMIDKFEVIKKKEDEDWSRRKQAQQDELHSFREGA